MIVLRKSMGESILWYPAHFGGGTLYLTCPSEWCNYLRLCSLDLSWCSRVTLICTIFRALDDSEYMISDTQHELRAVIAALYARFSTSAMLVLQLYLSRWIEAVCDAQ